MNGNKAKNCGKKFSFLPQFFMLSLASPPVMGASAVANVKNSMQTE